MEMNLVPAIAPIMESLQRLIGLHRQLLDACRMEREALIAADLKLIEESTLTKQTTVEAIRAAEGARLQRVADLALALKQPVHDLSLPNLAILVQGKEPKLAEQLRSAFNALTVLIQRITEQNEDNRALIHKSIAHVNDMKRNVLGEAVPRSDTYTAHGQKAGVTGGARLISKEA